MGIELKYNSLVEILKRYDKLCVAYSGGVDSDLLLNAACDALGENVLAVIVNGSNIAKKDIDDAFRLAKKTKAKVFVEDVDVFSEEEFRNNTKLRCYYCKKNIMSAVINRAKNEGYCIIADGKNVDDAKKYRPGAKAAEEMGIISPLAEAGFTKEDIRNSAKYLGLETFDKASNSCLATRFAYDTVLTEKSFEMVEKAELYLDSLGIESARVRVHGDIARIEVPQKYFEEIVKNKEILDLFKKIGFKFITLDLEGFRSGSMD